MAKYPFLMEAGNYLRDSGFSWEDLGDPHMKSIIERAIERIKAAMSGTINYKLDSREIEILTFLISLIIVKAIGIESVIRKYSLSEARRVEYFLNDDLRDKLETKKREIFDRIFRELFGLRIDLVDNGKFLGITVTDYLLRSSHFHEQEWKLINRLVHRGYVYLDTDEIVRLIRNEIATMIHSRIKGMVLQALPGSLQTTVDELRTTFAPKLVSNPQRIIDYPPCIQHAIEVMNKGENLPHSGRVMLATYMISIGKNIEDIVCLFQNAPDYNEKITRYQLEHLSGRRGSLTKYSVPSCEKVRNNNLCFATRDCDGIFNPLQFRKRYARNDPDPTRN